MKSSLINRINKINNFLAEKDSKHHPQINNETIENRIQLITKVAKPVLDTMNNEHRQELLQSLNDFYHNFKHHDEKRIEIDSSVRKPLHLLLNFVLGNGEQGNLYFGPEFYEAYKNGAINMKYCSDCDCGIPIYGGRSFIENGQLVHHTAKSITNKCPLCSGMVISYYQRFKKNRSAG